MPNWCQNTVVVSGDSAEISAFNDWLDNGTGLLNKIKPTPKELADTVAGFHGDPEKQKELEAQQKSNIEKYGHKDWYDWNIANWGTKWDLDVHIDDSISTGTEVIFSFDSAWAPPQKAISLMAEKFNSLNIRHSYFEEGMFFVGVDEYANGEPNTSIYEEGTENAACTELANEEFGWEPWPEDDENEAGQVTEVPKPAKEPAKKKVKKATAKKKNTKKASVKKKKKN